MFFPSFFILLQLVATAQIASVVATSNETYVLKTIPYGGSFRFAARQAVCPAYVFFANVQNLLLSLPFPSHPLEALSSVLMAAVVVARPGLPAPVTEYIATFLVDLKTPSAVHTTFQESGYTNI
jgi:hypothetical protein